jgi:hypothetical protein
VPQVAEGALINGTLSDQHTVFKTYWPCAQATSFSAAL